MVVSGGVDGDSDDDWDESDEWSESEDEMGFGLFDDVYEVSAIKEAKERGSFEEEGEEDEDEPTAFRVEIMQPKISKDKLGPIFEAQQLVRYSLTIIV